MCVKISVKFYFLPRPLLLIVIFMVYSDREIAAILWFIVIFMLYSDREIAAILSILSSVFILSNLLLLIYIIAGNIIHLI